MNDIAPSLSQVQPIEGQLRLVAELIASNVPLGSNPAPDACKYLVDSPGKALRARLLLLSASCGTVSSPCRERATILLAGAVELLHTATLYHDDVIDNASLRRGLPSANLRWGNRAATYAGDYLLSRAAGLFAQAGDHVNMLASKAIVRLARGQVKEIESTHDLEISLPSRLRIVEAKTAPLFELPCRLGALVSQADRRSTRALARFGRRLGVAFQLVDDLQDLFGDALALGKNPGVDLRQGIFGVAVIHCLRKDSVDSDRLKRALISRPDLDLREIRSLLRRSGSVDFTLRMINTCLDSAERALDLPESGGTKENLLVLTRTLRVRANHAEHALSTDAPPIC